MSDSHQETPWEALFVETMSRRRRALGMSQTALARELSERGLAFHQQTIQRIEGGERPIRLNEAVLIVQALGLSSGDTLGLDAAISPQGDPELARTALREAVVRASVAVRQTQQSALQGWSQALVLCAEARSGLDRYRALVGDARAEMESEQEISEAEGRLNMVASLFGDWRTD